MTSTDILQLLAKKFCPPYFVFLPQLRDATGFDASNTADAIALGLYRSRGRDLHGFEIKVSRSDWLRELKKPEKAERIAQYCDLWSIVVSDPEIVKLEELPTAWGLMVAFNGKLTVVKRAIRIDAAPLSRELLCSLVKKTFDLKHKPAEQELKELLEQEFERGKQAGRAPTDAGYLQKNFTELKERVQAFERASGVEIMAAWQPREKIGEAVRIVLHMMGAEKDFLSDREYFLQQAENMIKDQRASLEFLRAWSARTERPTQEART